VDVNGGSHVLWILHYRAKTNRLPGEMEIGVAEFGPVVCHMVLGFVLDYTDDDDFSSGGKVLHSTNPFTDMSLYIHDEGGHE
jgi:hypothetical protein